MGDGDHAMTNRIAVAVSAVLLCVGSTFAQPSTSTPPGPLSAVPSGVPSNAPLRIPITIQVGPPPASTAPPSTPPTSTPPTSDSLPALPSDIATPSTSPVAPMAPVSPAAPNNDPAFWASGDAVFSWFRGVRLPPLVTTSPAGTPATSAGIVGAPTTTTLFGGGLAEDGIREGFRVAAGYWFGADRILGVEAGYLMLGSQGTSFDATSAQYPILARPYVDATNFTNQAVLVAYPGTSTGAIAVDAQSGHFYSGNFDFAAKVVNDGAFRLVALAGYRFFTYDESLDISQTLNPTTAVVPAGTRIVSQDGFATHNIFNGLDLGLRPQFTWDALTLEGLLRVGIGNLHHTVDIAGSQTTTSPGFAPVTVPGGVYALTTNIGQHGSNDWVVFPEIGATLGWRITSNVQLRIGYGLLWLNGVARAPDQVNQIVNPLRFPGVTAPAGSPFQPAFYLTRTDLWIQNLNVGLAVTY